MPAQRTEALLELIDATGLDCVVVGGVAAVAHGATTATRDLDVAMEFSSDNLERLMTALAPYHPHHATRPELGVIVAAPASLAQYRMLLLDTDLGRLDVLSRVDPIGGRAQLKTVALELLPGRTYRVIDLEQLIAVKAHVGRAKDRIVEAELRFVLASRTTTKA